MKLLSSLVCVLFLTSCGVFVRADTSSIIATENQCVILLHGLWRTSNSMFVVQVDLEEAGYFVVNQDYPSTQGTIAELADKYIPAAIEQCPKDSQVNYVTHSMGGILVRSYYARNDVPRPNRVVMMSPPNKGSDVVDQREFELLGGFMGVAGSELGTSESSTPNRLGPVNYPVGIVAGSLSINPIASEMIPGPDDGAVAISNMWVDGASEVVQVEATHSFMMFNLKVREQILSYLTFGHFAK